MEDEQRRSLLRSAKTIALVGAKDTPGQPVDVVGRYLIRAGYTLWPVHPLRQSVWGLPCFASLGALPGKADIINLFRSASACPAHAGELLALAWKPRVFWMQLGIRSPEVGKLLAPQGISVLEDLCIMVEHRRLCGGVD